MRPRFWLTDRRPLPLCANCMKNRADELNRVTVHKSTPGKGFVVTDSHYLDVCLHRGCEDEYLKHLEEDEAQ